MQTTIDDKLKLLIGKPIKVNDFGNIHPLTLSQVIDKGYTKYLNQLNVFCFEKEHFIKDAPEELTIFDFLMIAEDGVVQEMWKEALEFFLQDQVMIIKERMVIAVGSTKNNLRFINRLNYDDICFVIQVQNYIRLVDDVGDFNKNDKAKEIQEKLNKSRAEIKRVKNRENDDLESDFSDVLSALSVKGNVSKKDLLNYTMFQIYDEYKRLIHIEQYENNVMALMQGAKNIKLKHWSSKIQN